MFIFLTLFLFMELLKNFLEEHLLITSDKVFADFELYNRLLMEWNSKINLISRKNYDIENNVLNSIFFLTKYPLKGNEKIVDIGTGGGFPSIPLKIIYPGLKVTLNDSINKKIKVLNDIIRQMNLIDTETVWGRAEEINSNKEYFRQYDIAISKSVAGLDKLYLWSREFLNRNGRMLAIKGGDISDEKKLMKKFPSCKIKEIDFEFEEKYNIIDKKLIVISE